MILKQNVHSDDPPWSFQQKELDFIDRILTYSTMAFCRETSHTMNNLLTSLTIYISMLKNNLNKGNIDKANNHLGLISFFYRYFESWRNPWYFFLKLYSWSPRLPCTICSFLFSSIAPWSYCEDQADLPTLAPSISCSTPLQPASPSLGSPSPCMPRSPSKYNLLLWRHCN